MADSDVVHAMNHDPLCSNGDMTWLPETAICLTCHVIARVRADALDAAREAVVALPMMKIAGNFPLYDADEVIAAIDALKPKPDSATD